MKHSKHTKQIAKAKILIIFDGGREDSYNRVLGYVEVDGEDVGEGLLSEGLGKTSYKFKPYYRREDKYKSTQRGAYQDKKGIWSLPGYASPDTNKGYNLYYEAMQRRLEREGSLRGR